MYNNNLFDKNPSPKRRKAKDNPYTIFTVGPASDLHYYLSFVDNCGVSICMEISRQLFEAFDQFERDDLSYMNEMDNHYAVYEVSHPLAQKHVSQHNESIEESIGRTLWINDALSKLSSKQRRRLVLYYYHGFTYEQIAERERCTIRAVVKSIKSAERLLKIFLQ